MSFSAFYKTPLCRPSFSPLLFELISVIVVPSGLREGNPLFLGEI